MTGSAPVHCRLLGAALRKHREHLGYTLEDAARILECDRSKISRIETGLRGIRTSELRGLLTEYGVSEQEKSALAGIARVATADSWRLDYDDVLTRTGCEYVQLEMAASQLQVYDPQHVPELLQTSGYAAALAAAGPGRLSGETDSRLTAVTLARQRAILKERQPELNVVIDQAALHRIVGGPQVMRAQLRRLATAAEEASHVTVQVLPFSSGVHAVGTGGPATILRFAGAPGLGVVYLPWLGQGGTCLVSPSDLACYTRAFTRLAAAALTPPESARMLAELAGG